LGKDGYKKEFPLIFNNDAAYTGACTCPGALLTLNDQFLTAGVCVDTKDYTCEGIDFFGTDSRCYVPATADLANGYQCSLTARIEKYMPCNKAAIGNPGSNTITPPAATVAPPAVATDPPPAVTDPPPAADATATAFSFQTQPPPPTNENGDDNGDMQDQKDTPVCDESIVIPGKAHFLVYCMAIMGWYNTCTYPDPNTPDDDDSCGGATLTELDAPLFVDLDSCYSNPNLGGKSVSFFGETPDKQKVMEFHLIFEQGIKAPYGPLNCDSRGVCECSDTRKVLEQQFLAAGECSGTNVYSWLSSIGSLLRGQRRVLHPCHRSRGCDHYRLLHGGQGPTIHTVRYSPGNS
jgi:hypothetical protein